MSLRRILTAHSSFTHPTKQAAQSKASYAKAQADLLESERKLATENTLKIERDAEEAEKTRIADEEKAAKELEEKQRVEAEAKARREAGEYEPLKGEAVAGIFLNRSALDLTGVGVILRIVHMDSEGGDPLGTIEHLFIPNVRPVNGFLKKSGMLR